MHRLEVAPADERPPNRPEGGGQRQGLLARRIADASASACRPVRSNRKRGCSRRITRRCGGSRMPLRLPFAPSMVVSRHKWSRVVGVHGNTPKRPVGPHPSCGMPQIIEVLMSALPIFVNKSRSLSRVYQSSARLYTTSDKRLTQSRRRRIVPMGSARNTGWHRNCFRSGCEGCRSSPLSVDFPRPWGVYTKRHAGQPR